MGKFVNKVGKSVMIESPIGELEWVIITGEGKLNTLNDTMQYTASLILDPESEDCKTFIAELHEYWEDNRPKKYKGDPKSMGYYAHKVKSDKTDEDGDPVYEESGKISFAFKTGTTYKDGKAKVITLFNSKGAKVSIGDQKIGNGSRGRIQGVCSVYEQPKAAGVSLYLNAIQLTKFVPYVGGPSFSAAADEEAGEDSFEGFDEDSGMTEEQEQAAPATPRL